MLNCDPKKVSQRAKKRGLPQMGTLGAGNHYAEIQESLPATSVSSTDAFTDRLLTKFSTRGQQTRWASIALDRSA